MVRAMRKLVTEAFGSLDDLVVVEAPDLEPAPGQVVVDVEAAGVNFVDGLIVEGRYQFTPPLPHTPGTEVAGRVAALGDGVDGLAVGQRVLALPATGGYASQVVVPSPAVVPIPDSITAGQAAGLVQSYATMLYAFTRRTTVTAGEWIAVLGAGGGVGLAATDLATALGAHVVACASSAEKLALASAAGAAATVAYEDTDLKTAIREATGGGADAIVDPVGGPKAESALRSLRWEGRYLVIGFAAGDIPRFPINQILLNSRTVIGIELGGWVRRDPAGYHALIAELMTLVAAGTVHPVEPLARPLAEAPRLLADLQARAVTGKAVLTP
jgi:NADPH2:quinone reductase